MAAKQNRNLIKNQRAKLKRRVIKIFENSNEIHLIHKAEVYALLESEGKFYMYCSSVEKGFPLSPAQLVS